MKLHTQETLDTMTPAKSLQFLKEGNQRFINNLKVNRDLLLQVNSYSGGQYPFAIILSCMDSRTTVEHVFDQGLGDVFVVRIAGNVLNDDIVGSLEYACAAVGTKLIMVLGHSSCGAIKGACSHVELGNLTQLLDKVQPAIATVEKAMPDADKHSPTFIEAVAKQNVLHVIDGIVAKSPVLAGLLKERKIGIAGGYYDISNGKVEFLKEQV
jgi:carbonic anhydrase